MRLQLDSGGVLFEVEASDTVDSVGRLINLLTGSQCSQQVEEDGAAYAIHIEPGDDRLPFVVAVPKNTDTNETLLALCAAYLNQQNSPD